MVSISSLMFECNIHLGSLWDSHLVHLNSLYRSDKACKHLHLQVNNDKLGMVQQLYFQSIHDSLGMVCMKLLHHTKFIQLGKVSQWL